MMTLEDFARHLATHGPDIDQWPHPLRRPALHLRDADTDAQILWEMAFRRVLPLPHDGLDAGMPDGHRVQAGIDASLRRIRNQVPATPAKGWWAMLVPSRPVGAVFATVAVAGWLAGTWLSPSPDAGSGEPALTALFSMTGSAGGWFVQ
ncbi:MAG: hypothetical protein PW843_02810 [Azospirillaceae bacterium]|nr:hypothetical protein [Azospirillaceae bacterium]